MTLNLGTVHYGHKIRTIKYAIVACLSLSIFTAISLVFLLTPARADYINATDFVMTWKTDNPGSTNDSSITLPMRGSNYSVDWNNDGIPDEVDISGTTVHDFDTPGTYTIRISGDHRGMDHYFWSYVDSQKLVNITQWGTSPWYNMDYAFSNATNMTITASDSPNITNVTSMRYTFSNASSMNGDLSNWDVSSVTDMSGLFGAAASFNQSIYDWDVSSVTNMNSMFANATSFNQPLDNWDVSNVVNMGNMFSDASSFNQPLNNWNVSSVTDMSLMFGSNVHNSFNQPLDNWDVSSVTNMSQMFGSYNQGTSDFNQNINNWNTSAVVEMTGMFSGASFFNQPLSNWDVSNVTGMATMFSRATSFNQPLNNWDTSKVTSINSIFAYASSFDQPLNDWDVSNVTGMSAAFTDATSFNQPLNNWDTSSVNAMWYVFGSATSFNQPLNNWDTSNVVDMTGVFSGATSFNQPLNNWDTSRATNMSRMFNNATVFSQDLSSWDVSSVTNMEAMFYGASVFDQSLGDWTIASLENAYYMLYATAFSSGSYDSTLIGWADQALQRDVRFGHTPAGYCLASSERQYIIDMYNWNIDDEGSSCGTLLVDNIEASTNNPVVLNGDQTSGVIIGILSVQGFVPTSYAISCGTAGSDDALFGISGDQLRTATPLSAAPPQDSDSDGRYRVCIQASDEAGRLIEQNVYIKISAPKHITDVSFENDGSRNILRVQGSGLVDDASGEYAQALSRSLITLGVAPLPFCSDGFGMTAQEIIDSYGPYGYDLEGLVSDSPPCYLLVSESFEPLITSTQATIYLPLNFDITASGSVSVNGSNTYSFNAVTDPEGPTDPEIQETIPLTAYSNGSKPLDQNPVLPKRPTFSGVATPGATVVVTVRSDPVSCSATADSTGNWSCTLPIDLVPGAHTVYVQVTNPDGSIQNLGPYAVTVAGETLSNVTPLAPNTGFMHMLQNYKQTQASNKTQALIVMVLALSAALVAIFAAVLIAKSRQRAVRFERS